MRRAAGRRTRRSRGASHRGGQAIEPLLTDRDPLIGFERGHAANSTHGPRLAHCASGFTYVFGEVSAGSAGACGGARLSTHLQLIGAGVAARGVWTQVTIDV